MIKQSGSSLEGVLAAASWVCTRIAHCNPPMGDVRAAAAYNLAELVFYQLHALLLVSDSVDLPRTSEK